MHGMDFCRLEVRVLEDHERRAVPRPGLLGGDGELLQLGLVKIRPRLRGLPARGAIPEGQGVGLYGEAIAMEMFNGGLAGRKYVGQANRRRHVANDTDLVRFCGRYNRVIRVFGQAVVDLEEVIPGLFVFGDHVCCLAGGFRPPHSLANRAACRR